MDEPLEAGDVGFEEARGGGEGGGSEEDRKWDDVKDIDGEEKLRIL